MNPSSASQQLICDPAIQKFPSLSAIIITLQSSLREKNIKAETDTAQDVYS